MVNQTYNPSPARSRILTTAIAIIIWTAIVYLFLICLAEYAHSAEWSKKDKTLQVGVTALTLVDWMQTRAAAKEPDRHCEIGPASWVIGEHPSVEQVDLYFPCSIIIKGLITHVLSPSYRAWWQSFCMGMSTSFIIHNHSIGLRVEKAF